MKFAGILSMTREASAEKLASRLKYFSAAAGYGAAALGPQRRGFIVYAGGVPKAQFAAAEGFWVRSEDLLGQRRTRTRHADDENRASRFMAVRAPPSQPIGIVERDDLINASGKTRTVVLVGAALFQLIGEAVAGKCIVEVLHVIEIFSEGIAQIDLLTNSQGLAEKPLRGREPSSVRLHFAVASEAGPRLRLIRGDGNRPSKQLLGVVKTATVRLNLAKQRQRFARVPCQTKALRQLSSASAMRPI